MSLELSLNNLCDLLVMGIEKLIGEDDFFNLLQSRVMIDSRVQVEEDWEVYVFLWLEKLIFKAKALDFIEVEDWVIWVHLVDWQPNDWLIWVIVGLVEHKSSLSCVDYHMRHLRLEPPVHVRVHPCFEMNCPFLMHIQVLCINLVVYMRRLDGETPSLTEDFIERNDERAESNKEDWDSCKHAKRAPSLFISKLSVLSKERSLLSDNLPSVRALKMVFLKFRLHHWKLYLFHFSHKLLLLIFF
jgi:hypothetical protein